MDTSLPFRRWLKRARAERDITQDLLAEQVGCAVDTIRAFETGRRRPSRAMAERLAEVLDIPRDQQAAFIRSARTAEDTPAEDQPSSPPLVSTDPTPAPPPPMRVPAPPTALIGRAREEVEVRGRVLDPACRLVTLTGAGGIGKTRLAMQIASSLAHDPSAQALFTDGVIFVALAQATAADHVALIIADTVGAPLMTTGSTEESLLHWLRDRHLLLVLDNLEHLLDAAPLLHDILRDAPGLRLLVTSRERLLIQGEWVVEIGGLALPHTDTREAIDRADAVLLFLERARQMGNDFALTPSNRSAVARICRLLDGMPLGIELAAAWVQTLTPDEIAAELERSLDLPERAWRDLPQRHRSLRAIFDHSWQLLTPTDQQVLCRLSIFPASFTREAAKEIASATLPVIASLADKSLLRRSGEGRYEMHPLVRRFAAEQLERHPSLADESRRQHANYFARWLEQREHAVLTGMNDDIAVLELRAEIDNIWMALDWIIEHKNGQLFQQMSTTMMWFLEFRCSFREGITLFQRAAAALAPQATSSAATPDDILAYGQTRAHEGWLRLRSGDGAGGVAVLHDSLTILRKQHQLAPLFRPSFGIGASLIATGAYDEAQRWLRESLEIARAVGNQHDTAYALTMLGNAVHVQGQLQHAHDLLQEALSIWRVIGIGVVPCLNRLGAVLLDMNELDQATTLLQESLHISSNRDDPEGFAAALTLLGKGAASRGQIDESIYLLDESIAIFRKLGTFERLAKALVLLGWSRILRSEYHLARQAFVEALEIGRQRELAPVVCNALWGITNLHAQQQAWTQALPLLLHILDHPATEHSTRTAAAHLRAEIEPLLEPAQRSSICDQERTRSFESFVLSTLASEQDPKPSLPTSNPVPKR